VDVLEIDDLTHTYPDGTAALRGVSLRVERGASLGLIGPNGAGKSTLLLAVLGFVRSRGTIRVGDVALSRDTLREIRRRVGIVFQNADDQLFMPTVFDDVAFGPLCAGLREGEVCRRVSEALEAVGAGHLVDRAPYHLSGGEKRRVALATVLAMRPEVVLFDEPTSSLDPASREQFIALVRDLPATRIVATHDLATVAAACSRTAILFEGRIVAQGNTGELLADADLMQRVQLSGATRAATPQAPCGGTCGGAVGPPGTAQ